MKIQQIAIQTEYRIVLNLSFNSKGGTQTWVGQVGSQLAIATDLDRKTCLNTKMS